MSDFLAHLRKLEAPGWLRVAYCLIFLVAFAHAVATEGAIKRLPAGVRRHIDVRRLRASRRRVDRRGNSPCGGDNIHGLPSAESLQQNQG